MEQTMVAKKFKVEIVYNGVTKPFEVQPHEQVQAVLKQAIASFSITQNPHLLSLFREDGSEVPDHSSIEGAGIQPGERLALRPSSVKAG
ncbi:MAG: hypothetical protein KGS09_13955 [Nitrospirae bacterium]|nr:hypothetical protein [Nitrospirota bacterium]MBU6481637.1 hypothetical protein [Nitrospirota bacterium]MDE3039154.1 hypothetical protein [Nitrospirota bacterium]MDE3220631.1 hypothetical protein [Nitrospirota bacterium]